MVIDDKGKLFGKISIIDIVVVLFILAALGGAYYKFFMTGQGGAAAQFDTLRYQTIVKMVRQPSVDAILEGADAYDGESGNYIGKIIDKQVRPAMGFIEKADGTIVEAQAPDRFDVLVTLEVPGVENDHGYFANGTIEIKRGSDLKLSTRMIEVQSRVTDVEKVE